MKSELSRHVFSSHKNATCYSLRIFHFVECMCLRNEQLSGSLLFSISQLNLKWPRVSNNNFKGSLPECLFHVKSITLMKLDNNQFTGSLLNSNTKLSKLILFRATSKKLTGAIYARIKHASQLKYLSLYINLTHGTIPEFVFNLTALEEGRL